MTANRWSAVWHQTWAKLVRSNLLWYGLTASLLSGIPILLLPFLVNRLPTDQFAHVVTMQVIVMFGGLLINLGMDGSVARDALRVRLRHRSAHVTIALGTQFTLFLLLCGLALVFARDFERLVEYPAARLHPTILGCFLQQITLFTAGLMRIMGRVRTYASLSICQAGLEIGISLSLLYTVVPNWEARLWGLLAASSVTAVGAIGVLWRMGLVRLPRFSGLVLKRMLNFGLPTLPHTLCSLASAWSDRFLLIHFSGVATAGIYAAAAQSVFVISFVGSVVNLTWTPWLYRQLSSPRTLAAMRPAIASMTYRLAIVLMFGGIAVLPLLVGYFFWIAPSAYRPAIGMLPWLALGATANAIYKVATNFLFFYGETRFLAGVAFSILMISLVAQVIFVPLYQGMASAIVFAFINLVQLACTWTMANRLFRFGSPLNGIGRWS